MLLEQRSVLYLRPVRQLYVEPWLAPSGKAAFYRQIAPMDPMAEWAFYGRTEPLSELRRVIEAGHWFFCRIEGRRRIGKTTLLGQLAGQSDDFGSKLIYMQTPDSDERDVAATLRRSLAESDRDEARALTNSVVDFPSMAAAIGELCRAGMVVVLDEFQYFTRSALRHFNSFLQAEV